MITFAYLDKAKKDLWLPRLFDLLHANMSRIAPSGLEYGEEKSRWLSQVSPALDKAPRQILLCFVGDDLAGYMQYYIREDLLMIEELQLAGKYQRSTVFFSFCRFFLGQLPENIARVEAWADTRNLNSRKLMAKLGMEEINPAAYAPFVLLRGSASVIASHFNRP